MIADHLRERAVTLGLTAAQATALLEMIRRESVHLW